MSRNIKDMRIARTPTLPIDPFQTYLEIHQDNLASGLKSTGVSSNEILSSGPGAVTVTDNYEALVTDMIIYANMTNKSVTMNASKQIGSSVMIWKISDYDGDAVTVLPGSGITIEGLSELKLYGKYSFVELERISATVFAIKTLEDLDLEGDRYSRINDEVVSDSLTWSSAKIQSKTEMEESLLLPQYELVTCGYTIRTDNLVWEQSSVWYGALINISEYKNYRSIRIFANSNGNNISYTMLKSDNRVDGASPDFCTGFSNIFVSSNDFVDIIIPKDANYLYVYMKSGETDYTPSSIEFNPKYEFAYIDSTKTSIRKILYEGTITSCGATIVSNVSNAYYLKWMVSPSYVGALIDLSMYRVFNSATITRNLNGNGFTYTFLKTNSIIDGESPDWATGYEQKIIDCFEESITAEIPEDANYLYVYMKSGEVDYTPSSIEFSFHFFASSSVIEKSNLLKGLSPRSIKVATWNIGHFSGGALSTPLDAYTERLNDYIDLIYEGLDPDVIGVEEYSISMNDSGNTRDALFMDFSNKYEYSRRNYSCNAFFGNPYIENTKRKEYICLADETVTHTSLIKAKDYYYILSDLYLNGRLVKIVTTHLAFDSNRPDILQQNQINELIQALSSFKRVIILGDFNTENFSSFTSNNYLLANDGSFKTYGGDKALDNIVVKGLTISDAFMISSDLSDHNPICCTISI